MLFNIFGSLFKGELKNNINTEFKAADEINNNLMTYNDKSSKIYNALTINIANLVGCTPEQSISDGLLIGNNNQQLLGLDVQNLLKVNNISQETVDKQLRNPELLVAITDASKIGYKESNINKRKILADLIYNKIAVNDEFESLILSQSIKAIEFLTENQLKILALIFLLHSTYFKKLQFTNWNELNIYFNETIIHLIDINLDSAKNECMNLFTSGCLITFTFGTSADSFFNPIIANFIKKPLERDKIDSLNLSQIVFQNIIKVDTNTNDYYFCDTHGIDFEDFLNRYIENNKLTSHQKEILLNLYKINNYDAKNTLKDNVENFDKLLEFWQKILSLSSAGLNPIGKLIGADYLKLKTGIIIDWKEEQDL